MGDNRYGRQITLVDKAELGRLSQAWFLAAPQQRCYQLAWGILIIDDFIKGITVISGFTDIFRTKFHNIYLFVVEIIHKINQ